MIAHQLEQDTMWVYEGYGHWKEYPYDHIKSVTYRQALDGMLPDHRTRREQEFKFWFEKRTRMYAQREKLPYRMKNLDVPVVDLFQVLSPEHRDSILYENWHDVRGEYVALKKIISTQSEVNQALVKWYLSSGYDHDEDGHPPYAIRFYGDEQVYLTNGHHRYARNLERSRGNHAMMYLKVNYCEMTFDEACGKLEPFPVDVVNLFEILLEGVA